MLRISKRQQRAVEQQNVDKLKKDLLHFLSAEPEFARQLFQLTNTEVWIDEMVEEGRKLNLHSERSIALFTTTRLFLKEEPVQDAQFVRFLAETCNLADQEVEAAIKAVRD